MREVGLGSGLAKADGFGSDQRSGFRKCDSSRRSLIYSELANRLVPGAHLSLIYQDSQ